MPEFNLTFILVLVSFVLFMLLMKAIYFDPILRIQADREHQLKNDADQARIALADAERLEQDTKAALQQARKKALTLLQERQQAAKQTAQEQLKVTRAEVQADTQQKLVELAQWREEAYTALNNERAALKQLILTKVLPMAIHSV